MVKSESCDDVIHSSFVQRLNKHWFVESIVSTLVSTFDIDTISATSH